MPSFIELQRSLVTCTQNCHCTLGEFPKTCGNKPCIYQSLHAEYFPNLRPISSPVSKIEDMLIEDLEGLILQHLQELSPKKGYVLVTRTQSFYLIYAVEYHCAQLLCYMNSGMSITDARKENGNVWR